MKDTRLIQMLIRNALFIIILIPLINIVQAEDSIPKYRGTIDFEVALGSGRCLSNNLTFSDQAGKVVNRGLLSGVVNIKYTFKYLSVLAGFYGPYEYSTNIAPDSNRNEGDILILKDSELAFGNGGVCAVGSVDGPIGFNIQPSIGYRSYYVNSDIEAISVATGDKLNAKGSSSIKGAQIGLILKKAILTKRENQRIKRQWCIEPQYNYQFSKYHISDYGIRTTISFYKPKGWHSRNYKIFIEYKQNEGILLKHKYLMLGLSIDTSPSLFFTN